MTGHNIDPAKYRDKNEKITDKIRQFIEKKFGKKVRYSRLAMSGESPLMPPAQVPEKFSN